MQDDHLRRLFPWVAGTLALACALLLPSVSPARPPGVPLPTAESPTEAASPTSVEDRRKAAETDSSLAEDVRAQVLEHYDRAIEANRQAETENAANLALHERVYDGPKRLEKLRADLDAGQAAGEATPTVDAKLPITELAEIARAKRSELRGARDSLKAHEKALAALTTAGAKLGDEVAERQKELRAAEASRARPRGRAGGSDLCT